MGHFIATENVRGYYYARPRRGRPFFRYPPTFTFATVKNQRHNRNADADPARRPFALRITQEKHKNPANPWNCLGFWQLLIVFPHNWIRAIPNCRKLPACKNYTFRCKSFPPICQSLHHPPRVFYTRPCNILPSVPPLSLKIYTSHRKNHPAAKFFLLGVERVCGHFTPSDGKIFHFGC